MCWRVRLNKLKGGEESSFQSTRHHGWWPADTSVFQTETCATGFLHLWFSSSRLILSPPPPRATHIHSADTRTLSNFLVWNWKELTELVNVTRMVVYLASGAWNRLVSGTERKKKEAPPSSGLVLCYTTLSMNGMKLACSDYDSLIAT